MPSIITNRNLRMIDELKTALRNAERIDIWVAFFYFSGFNALAEELKDKKIRILVGKTIDPEAISDLCRALKINKEESLEAYAVRGFINKSNSQKRNMFTRSFIDMVNKSALSEEFDSTESQNVFKMFMDKMQDGSLEIRMTKDPDHAKAYIITNKPNSNLLGEKGAVFMGSSNFTYNGLVGQGELNEAGYSNDRYDEYENEFESLWNDSKAIDISVKDGADNYFEREIKKHLWIFAKPSPYQIYVRILYELYNSIDQNEVETPSEITNGKFANFKYQIDAIKAGVDCINRNNGVIIADVVGLGKSVIASAIARNLDMPKTVVIAPPHLVGQWEDYQQDFGIRGARVFSSGKIEDVYKNYATDPNPILFILDEAHRYRNELTDDYQYLHQLTRSNPENKVILLSATPYNNRPQDLFALVKLFQTPSRSTINSVDNLSVKFHELITRYNKLEKEGKKNLTDEIKRELDKLSDELRILINPVIIRRSRIDLQEITEYAEDLRLQNIQFPEVVGPELEEYDLGEIRQLYLDTLDQLSNRFICARYNPSSYLKDIDAFNKKYGELFNEINIQQFQRNLAEFIKRQLVMRFESSKAAFKTTLDNILKSNENIKKWWAKGYVPIKKSGYLSDPDEEDFQETLDAITNIDSEPIDINKIKKKALPFDKDLFKEDFIVAVQNDIDLLTEIYHKWFSSDEIGIDPKYNKVVAQINALQEENRNRKIVIFSSYADTAVYVHDRLSSDGFRVLLYKGSSSNTDRDVVKRNFDASCRATDQENNYDIIVATDALSEGFNLNRAGALINYDIPYNPTRVVQRIGRINRINRKMFEKLFIYNFFPTDIGEENTLIKGISTLKMLLINNIVGSDTKTLTPDETLKSYFKRLYDEASAEEGGRSWDTQYRNDYYLIKNNTVLLNKAMDIPERARIVRKGQPNPCAVSFAKRGDNSLFALAYEDCPKADILPPEQVLNYFKAVVEEAAYPFDEKVDEKFSKLRAEITKPYQKIKMDKRRGEAIDNLEKLKSVCNKERGYIDDLLAVIKNYDDLSDGELKYLANLKIPTNADDAFAKAKEIKQKIPENYIDNIKTRAEAIDAQAEIIMFTEDLRNDD